LNHGCLHEIISIVLSQCIAYKLSLDEWLYEQRECGNCFWIASECIIDEGLRYTNVHTWTRGTVHANTIAG
jgi:hypothetical protein